MLPWILQGILSLGILVVVVNIVVTIVRNTSIKQLIWGVVILGVLILGGYLLSRLDPGTTASQFQSTPQVAPTEPPDVYETSPLGDPPTIWFMVVKVSVILSALLFCAWLIYQSFQARRREDAIAIEVGAALRAIEAGEDVRNVILNAYLRMLQIVKEEQGIEREESVTPREFETLLAARGIPREPILQITRLFEKVRYGSKSPDPADEQAAIACLTTIREACLSVNGRSK